VPATRALPRATATFQDTTNPHGLPITPWAGPGRAHRLGRSRTPHRRPDAPAARRL